jgi:hypothetical protein
MSDQESDDGQRREGDYSDEETARRRDEVIRHGEDAAATA